MIELSDSLTKRYFHRNLIDFFRSTHKTLAAEEVFIIHIAVLIESGMCDWIACLIFQIQDIQTETEKLSDQSNTLRRVFPSPFQNQHHIHSIRSTYIIFDLIDAWRSDWSGDSFPSNPGILVSLTIGVGHVLVVFFFLVIYNLMNVIMAIGLIQSLLSWLILFEVCMQTHHTTHNTSRTEYHACEVDPHLIVWTEYN